MTDFLLKLCGLKIEGASHVSGVEFALRNTMWLGWVVALAVLLAGLAWYSYWRDSREILTRGRRRFLTGLRMFLFALLLLLLLRPVLAFRVESSIRRSLLTLVDASASMKIQDPRFDPADLIDAAKRQHPDKPWLAAALARCTHVVGASEYYVHFVNPRDANEAGADWQFRENVVLESPTDGDVILDVLKDGRVGGAEYLGRMLAAGGEG